MLFNVRESISDVPLVKLRRAFLALRPGPFSLDQLARSLRLSRTMANGLCRSLVRYGYIRDVGGRTQEARYVLADRGEELMVATPTDMVRRIIYDIRCASFERFCDQHNRRRDVVYLIDKIEAFGPFVSKDDYIPHIDLVVSLASRAGKESVEARQSILNTLGKDLTVVNFHDEATLAAAKARGEKTKILYWAGKTYDRRRRIWV